MKKTGEREPAAEQHLSGQRIKAGQFVPFQGAFIFTEEQTY